jgi:ABC-type sugar transport system substrate-binding protein
MLVCARRYHRLGAPAPPQSQEETMPSRRVAVFLTVADNDYQQGLKREAEAAAARLGFEVEVSFAGTDPGKISLVQPQQIYQAVNRDPGQRPVAVIVLPVLDIAHTAKEVVAGRIGVIILNRFPPFVEDLRSANPGLPVFAVSADQVATGRLQGRQLRALLPDGGLVLGVLGNPLASSTSDRASGLRQAIEGTSIRLTTVNGDWHAASGEEVVVRWLRQPWNKEKIAAIACHNDAMAVGACKAVQRLSAEAPFSYLRGVPILGIDGSPELGMKMVETGELAATIVMPATTRTAIEMLARALSGETIPAFVNLAPKSHPSHLVAG